MADGVDILELEETEQKAPVKKKIPDDYKFENSGPNGIKNWIDELNKSNKDTTADNTTP